MFSGEKKQPKNLVLILFDQSLGKHHKFLVGTFENEVNFEPIYINAKEMTAFVKGNFTNLMGVVLTSLKSCPGDQVGVRAGP